MAPTELRVNAKAVLLATYMAMVSSYRHLTHFAKLIGLLAVLQAYQVLSPPRNCLCSNLCLEFSFPDTVILPS